MADSVHLAQQLLLLLGFLAFAVYLTAHAPLAESAPTASGYYRARARTRTRSSSTPYLSPQRGGASSSLSSSSSSSSSSSAAAAAAASSSLSSSSFSSASSSSSTSMSSSSAAPRDATNAAELEMRHRVERLLLFNFSGHPYSVDRTAMDRRQEPCFLPREKAGEAAQVVAQFCQHVGTSVGRGVRTNHVEQWTVEVDMRDESVPGGPHTVTVPAVHLLQHLYTVHQYPELRDIFLNLLDPQCGAQRADFRTPQTKAVLPIIYQILETFPMDLTLFEAVAASCSAAALQAVLAPSPVPSTHPRSGASAIEEQHVLDRHVDGAIGVSLLHLIVQDQSNMLSKHLLQVQDHMRLEQGCTVREAFAALSHGSQNNTSPAGQDEYWYEVAEYATLRKASPDNFGVLESHLNDATSSDAKVIGANSASKAPMVEVVAKVVHRIDEDIAIAKFNALLAGRSVSEVSALYRQLLLRVPDRHWNPLHVVALNAWPRFFFEVVERTRLCEQPVEPDAVGSGTIAGNPCLETLMAALTQPDQCCDRSPAHIAAMKAQTYVSHGDTLFPADFLDQVVDKMRHKVARSGTAPVSDIEVWAHQAVDELQDDLGNSCRAYLRGEAQFPVERFQYRKAHSERGADHLIAMERDLHRIRTRRNQRHAAGLPDGHEASVVDLSTFGKSRLHAADGLSWRDILDPTNHTLALRAVKAADSLKERFPCSVRTVHSFPSLQELQALLEKQEPVIIRVPNRTVLPFDLGHSYFSPASMLARFGNLSAEVSPLPYQDSFQSPFRKRIPTRNVTVRDYIRMVSAEADTNVRRLETNDTCNNEEPGKQLNDQVLYLFGTAFYTQYPEVLRHAVELMDYARQIPHVKMGIGALAEMGGRPETEALELNAQFYFGGPGSGAPMHYHASAINYLSHGTKEWLLIPPASALYSTVPALEYFENGLPATDETVLPPGIQACTQQQGDIFIVPDKVGHATLNTEMAIGTAFEVKYWPTFAGELDSGMVNFFFVENVRREQEQLWKQTTGNRRHRRQ